MLRPWRGDVFRRHAHRALAHAAAGSSMEEKMKNLLKDQLKAEHVEVEDISGGCGAMYTIQVVAEVFEGKPRVAQHRMVNEVGL